MKPIKCPAREKQHEAGKAKKRGGEKAKSKSQDCRFTFKLQKLPQIFAFCACHDKAVNCTTCKQLCGEL